MIGKVEEEEEKNKHVLERWYLYEKERRMAEQESVAREEEQRNGTLPSQIDLFACPASAF